MGFEELRKHVRIPVEIEVSMMSEHNFYAGLTDNLSTGGVFFATYQPPPVNAPVELVLRLPEQEQTFVLSGVVRWIRSCDASCEGAPPGCGVQWRELPDAALQAIAAFVRGRETILYDDAA